MNAAARRRYLRELIEDREVTNQAELVAELVPGTRWREAEPDEAHLALAVHPEGGRWGAYDISRIREACGWQPRPLKTALAEYRDWLTAHPY